MSDKQLNRMFTEAVVEGIGKMSFAERLRFFEQLRERWCLHCGGDGPEETCIGCRVKEAWQEEQDNEDWWKGESDESEEI